MQTYKIDADAAEKPVESYSTLQEFFTRKLKPGLRPIAAPG
jgi:phosphatidylserine decarboxylase